MTKKTDTLVSQDEFDALKLKVEKLEIDLKALKEHYKSHHKLHQKVQTVVSKRYLNKHEMD